MKKVLVLTYFEPKGRPHTPLYTKHALAGHSVKTRALRSFFVAHAGGTKLYIENPLTKEKLSDFDGVYMAGWRIDAQLGLAMAKHLKQNKVPFVGRTLLSIYPSTKLGEMAILVEKGIAYPKTFYASKSKDLLTLFDWACKKFGLEFPVVVKATGASGGNNNHLVKTRSELESIASRAKKHFLIQEFLPNDFDYRLLVVGSKVKLVMKRQRANQNTHVNNTSKGAKAELIEPAKFPRNIKRLAVKAAKTLGRSDLAGVDIVVNKETGKPYVLEVNRTPNIVFGVSEDVDIAHKLKLVYSHLNKLMRGV